MKKKRPSPAASDTEISMEPGKGPRPADGVRRAGKASSSLKVQMSLEARRGVGAGAGEGNFTGDDYDDVVEQTFPASDPPPPAGPRR